MLNKKKNNKGFTLVELLVVIAIIGILAVVAVPALFKNINKAKVADLEADYNAIKSSVLSYYTDKNTLPTTKVNSVEGLGKLTEYMDSVPEKSSLGEGTYTLKEEATSDSEGKQSLFLTIGEYKLANEEDTHEADKHTQGCFTNGEGITLTKDQTNKIISDMGDSMVYYKNIGETTTIDKLPKDKAQEGIILKLKLIDNTSTVTSSNE